MEWGGWVGGWVGEWVHEKLSGWLAAWIDEMKEKKVGGISGCGRTCLDECVLGGKDSGALAWVNRICEECLHGWILNAAIDAHQGRADAEERIVACLFLVGFG